MATSSRHINTHAPTTLHRVEPANREYRSSEKQLAEAKRTLIEHDRPLHRRQHRASIRQAKRDVAALPGKLGELDHELTDLDTRYDLEKKAQRRTIDATAAGPDDRAIEQTEAALSNDARIRGEQLATAPDQRYLDHLGPVSSRTEERERWIEAAGRVAQHHAIWGQPTGPTFVGHMPTFNNDEDYRRTFYAANRAIHLLGGLAGTPHQVYERDTPGLSL